MSKYIYLELDRMNSQDIRVVIMGRTDGLYEETVRDLAYCQESTKDNKSMLLNVAVNYGSRTEIADAARAIAADVQQGKLALEQIDEKTFAEHLYMPYLPDLDLLIRTSGEMRVSNFMLWQLSYAEFVPMPVLWPDFRRRHLRQAILTYQSRNRRFGARK
jgi:undecaprenyl diphosphate synthase